MKKIYIISIMALTLASCQVSNPYSKVTTSTSLIEYSLGRMTECVIMPAEILETAIGLDAYLKSSDEEKTMNRIYYGVVSDYGNNTYGVYTSDNRELHLSFIVDTKGKSIWEDDVEWEFASISGDGGYYDQNIYVNLFLDFGEGPTLTKAKGDSTWTFTVQNKLKSDMKLLNSDSLYHWNIVAFCTDEGENDMTSYSSTGNDGINIVEHWEGVGSTYPYRTNSYGGTFNTDIYKANEKVDFSTSTFRPGFETRFVTSR